MQIYVKRCLNESINLLHKIGSFASGANAFLVAKTLTKKNYSTTVDKIITSEQILVFELSKQLFLSPQDISIICKWRQ